MAKSLASASSLFSWRDNECCYGIQWFWNNWTPTQMSRIFLKWKVFRKPSRPLPQTAPQVQEKRKIQMKLRSVQLQHQICKKCIWNYKTVVPAMSSESDGPPIVLHILFHLEFSTDASFPPSCDPSSYTTYSSTMSNKKYSHISLWSEYFQQSHSSFPRGQIPTFWWWKRRLISGTFDIDPKIWKCEQKESCVPGSRSFHSTLWHKWSGSIWKVSIKTLPNLCGPFLIWIRTRSEISEEKLKNSNWWTAVWDTIISTWMKRIKLKEVCIIEMSINKF